MKCSIVLSKRILLYLRDQIAQCLWIAERFMIQYPGSYCDIILIVTSSGRILAMFVARKQNYNGQTYNIYVSNLVKPRKRTILLKIVCNISMCIPRKNFYLYEVASLSAFLECHYIFFL